MQLLLALLAALPQAPTPTAGPVQRAPERAPDLGQARRRAASLTPFSGMRGAGGPRDTVIFLADDLGELTLGALPTPALDRLRDEGVSYRRAYSMPVCSASRYALLFGEYGRRDGIYRLIVSAVPALPGDRLPAPELPSIADLFKAAGYRTGLFGKWHVGVSRYGVSDMGDPTLSPHYFGFDTWRAGSWSNLTSGGTGYYDWTRVDDGEATLSTDYADLALVEALEEWWAEPSDRPRFAFVSFRLPHAPNDLPPPELLPAGWPEPVSLRERHETMVVALDGLMERLIRWSDDDPDGVLDARTTHLVFTSDNGTPPNVARPLEEPSRVKTSVYEGGVRMPLFARPPGGRAGIEDGRLIHLVDFFGLVAHELGIPSLGGRDSRVFPAGVDRTNVMVEIVDDRFLPPRDRFALVTPRYKLQRRNGAEFVYDLLLDPAEDTPMPMTTPEAQAIRAALLAEEADLPERR